MTLYAGRAHSEATEASSEVAGFDQVFDQHWSRVHAIVYRIVGDSDEAEDITLEAFRRLHSWMDGGTNLDDAARLGGWLYRVATNLALNALRSRKRRQQYEAEAGQAMLRAASPRNPAAEVERAEERARTRRALSEMKPRSARLLILRHSGFSYAEVAAAVGVSPASVGTLLARAEREFEERYRALEGRAQCI